MTGSVEDLFTREFARLVRTLAVAFDAEAAADAVQEAFLAADRRWSHVGDLDDPAAWVRRVALNRLLNGRRNHRRRAEILAGIRPVVVDELSVAHVDLHRALRELPDRMRLTICLHYLADLSVAEIAADLDVAPGTVKSNLHDGRTRLRSLLEESHD